jgi:IPT/TIG domain
MTSMRIADILRPLLFWITFFFFARTADALVHIQGDQDGQARITIKLVYTDDADDTDQTVTDPDKAIIQIENRLRRYVGVFILRNINGSSVYYEVVDNGPNDRFIDTASELVSYGTILDFVTCFFGSGGKATLAPSSRRYILPIARGQSGEVTPGMENCFQVEIVGPSIEGFPLYWDSTSSPGDLAIDAALWTAGFLIVIPALDLLAPGLRANAELSRDIIPEVVNFLKQVPSILTCFQQENPYVCIEAAVKKLLESHLLPDLLKSKSVQQKLSKHASKEETLKSWADKLEDVKDTLMSFTTAADLVNTLIQITGPTWSEVFEVFIIRPRVDSIEPNMAPVGEEVTIHGAGFDTYNPSNNLVKFTEVTGGTQEARIVSVPDENTIVVEVPAGDLGGPVLVCDTLLSGIIEVYCSNNDVDWRGLYSTTLCITSPEDGATVGEWTDIVVELKDLPEDAFAYGDLVADLFVDGVKQKDKYVNSAIFSFLAFNTGSLAQGPHTIEVRLNISGRIIRDSIKVFIPSDDSFPRTYRGSLRAGTSDYAETRPIAIVLEDRESEKSSGVQYYTLVLTCKFKLRKGPKFEDTEEEQHYYGSYNRKEYDMYGTTWEGHLSVLFDTVDLDNGWGVGYYDNTQIFGDAGGRYRDERFDFVNVVRCGTGW